MVVGYYLNIYIKGIKFLKIPNNEDNNIWRFGNIAKSLGRYFIASKIITKTNIKNKYLGLIPKLSFSFLLEEKKLNINNKKNKRKIHNKINLIMGFNYYLIYPL